MRPPLPRLCFFLEERVQSKSARCTHSFLASSPGAAIRKFGGSPGEIHTTGALGLMVDYPLLYS